MFLRFRSALPLALARTFSLCIDKKKGNDGHSSIGTTIGSEDFPHSTLGKRPPPNRNNLFETPRNRPIFAP